MAIWRVTGWMVTHIVSLVQVVHLKRSGCCSSDALSMFCFPQDFYDLLFYAHTSRAGHGSHVARFNPFEFSHGVDSNVVNS